MPENLHNFLLLPKPATLRRYGLSMTEYTDMAAAQGYVCYICEKLPPSRRLFVDHEHVRGFKKLPGAERKNFVRGLLCSACNYRILHKHATKAKLVRAVKYLEAYDARSPRRRAA